VAQPPPPGQVYLCSSTDCDVGRGSVTDITSDWVIQGIGDFNGDGKGRHPVAEQHHGAGLHLADEREHVDEQRQPGAPDNTCRLPIGLIVGNTEITTFGNIAG